MKTKVLALILSVITVIYALCVHKYGLPEMPVAVMIVVLFLLVNFVDDDNDIEPNMMTN